MIFIEVLDFIIQNFLVDAKNFWCNAPQSVSKNITKFLEHQIQYSDQYAFSNSCKSSTYKLHKSREGLIS